MIGYITAGESHGPCLTVIVEGLPAGVRVDESAIRADLARRQIPIGAGARMSIETDCARVTGGVMAGVTTGAPLAMTIENRNHGAWKGREVSAYVTARPGHADFAAAVKYGYGDIRPALERASARETASRVAAGAVCRSMLAEFGITVEGRVAEIGGVKARGDGSLGPGIEEAISAAKAEGETLGGVIEIVARGVQVGLGGHVTPEKRLDARLAGALMGMQAIKGVEIGDGFALARMKGTCAQDAILGTDGARRTNRMGGIEGGISNGMPIVARIAMKPIPTTLKPQETVNLATGDPAATVYERSDFCPVPRAVVVAEAIACVVIADALKEKLGGDSISEMKPRFESLARSARLDGESRIWWE